MSSKPKCILNYLLLSTQVSTAEASGEFKAIRVMPFSGQQKAWDEWSTKYQGIAAERGHLKVMLGNEDVPMDALDIDQKVETTI